MQPTIDDIEMSDEFIINCKNMGTEYGKIAEVIVEHGPLTDEQICDFSGIISIDRIRKIISDMISQGLIKGTRVKNEHRGWFEIKYQMVNK